MKQSDKILNPFNVKVGEVWQANREPKLDTRMPEAIRSPYFRHQRQLQRYGLRFKVVAYSRNYLYAVVENCFGPKIRRSIRLDRFNSSKKGYTRIGQTNQYISAYSRDYRFAVVENCLSQ